MASLVARTLGAPPKASFFLGMSRKTVEGYFGLLDDLLIAFRLPVFTRRAKRAMTTHPKFYFFDAGVYRALRPRGPLDATEEIEGAAIETLVAQELRATNDNLALGYDLYFWHTRDHREVDFVLYGERGLVAIEVKRSSVYRESDLAALRLFGTITRWRVARCSMAARVRTRSTAFASSRSRALSSSSRSSSAPDVRAICALREHVAVDAEGFGD